MNFSNGHRCQGLRNFFFIMWEIILRPRFDSCMIRFATNQTLNMWITRTFYGILRSISPDLTESGVFRVTLDLLMYGFYYGCCFTPWYRFTIIKIAMPVSWWNEALSLRVKIEFPVSCPRPSPHLFDSWCAYNDRIPWELKLNSLWKCNF